MTKATKIIPTESRNLKKYLTFLYKQMTQIKTKYNHEAFIHA